MPLHGEEADNLRAALTPDGVRVTGVAGGTAASPSIAGLEYNATPPTLADGETAPLQGDTNANLKTSLATLIAGEDTTNDRLKVEQRFTPFSVTADGQVKSGGGFLHTVTISPTTATPTAGLLTLYDNTAESGTVLYSEWVFATAPGHTITLNVTFGTGLYVGFDGTLANVRVSGSYR